MTHFFYVQSWFHFFNPPLMNLLPNVVLSSCFSGFWLKICSRLSYFNALGHHESCEIAFSFLLFCRLRSLLHKSLCRYPLSLQLVTLHAKLHCVLLQLLLWRCPFQSILTPWVWNCLQFLTCLFDQGFRPRSFYLWVRENTLGIAQT